MKHWSAPLRYLLSLAALLQAEGALANPIRLPLNVSGQILGLAPQCRPGLAPASDQAETASKGRGSFCVVLASPYAIPSIDLEIPGGCSHDGENLGEGMFSLFVNEQAYDPRTSNVASTLQLIQLRYGLGLVVSDESVTCERAGVLRIRY